MKLILELRAAEGGEDAKLLVLEMAAMYQAYAAACAAGAEITDQSPG